MFSYLIVERNMPRQYKPSSHSSRSNSTPRVNSDKTLSSISPSASSYQGGDSSAQGCQTLPADKSATEEAVGRTQADVRVAEPGKAEAYEPKPLVVKVPFHLDVDMANTPTPARMESSPLDDNSSSSGESGESTSETDKSKLINALREVAQHLKRSGHVHPSAFSDQLRQLSEDPINSKNASEALLQKWEEVIEASTLYGAKMHIIKNLVNQMFNKLTALKKEGAAITGEEVPFQHDDKACGLCGGCRSTLINQYNLIKRLSKDIHDIANQHQPQKRKFNGRWQGGTRGDFNKGSSRDGSSSGKFSKRSKRGSQR